MTGETITRLQRMTSSDSPFKGVILVPCDEQTIWRQGQKQQSFRRLVSSHGQQMTVTETRTVAVSVLNGEALDRF